MEFKWKYCRTCHTAYIKCPKCGNNSCNGGTGFIKSDGTILKFPYAADEHEKCIRCEICPQAYEVQEKGWKENSSPVWYRIKEWFWWNININIIRRLDVKLHNAIYSIRKGQGK